MTSRGKTLKLTAVSALVVLALTGFSTGRGHGGSSGHHDGDGGGGCSSSSQNHDSSSGSHRDYDDDDDYDDDYGSGGSGGSEVSAYPSAAPMKLVECASEEKPYATVEVTNSDTLEGTFSVVVIFKDVSGDELTRGTEEVSIPAGETTEVKVQVDDEASLPRIDACELDSHAPAA
ncbi:hypothetical protein G3I18_14765 [Actinospica acidiphila]|uniref:Secreted protein n=1 Tax=Actinospica acidiphila TaxID=304899 RepID=A0A9X5CJZ9_9ACTN|nr:hypothetical protein [Actinospica acidiphila]NEC49830.1 hypothetical protein [Actinospica acidiphila]